MAFDNRLRRITSTISLSAYSSTSFGHLVANSIDLFESDRAKKVAFLCTSSIKSNATGR